MGEVHVDAAVAFVQALSGKEKYKTKNIFRSHVEILTADKLQYVIDREPLSGDVIIYFSLLH